KVPSKTVFGLYEERIIKKMIETQIIPTIERLNKLEEKPKPDASSMTVSEGLRILQSTIKEWKDPTDKLKQVENCRRELLRKKSSPRPTTMDAAAFIGLTKSTYEREVKRKIDGKETDGQEPESDSK